VTVMNLLAPRLDLRQSQSLVMTPQLRQAIKLLQSSNLDVSAFVEEELERNPLLERDEQAPPGPDDAIRLDMRPAAPAPSASDDCHTAMASGTLPAEAEAPLIGHTCSGTRRRRVLLRETPQAASPARE